MAVWSFPGGPGSKPTNSAATSLASIMQEQGNEEVKQSGDRRQTEARPEKQTPRSSAKWGQPRAPQKSQPSLSKIMADQKFEFEPPTSRTGFTFKSTSGADKRLSPYVRPESSSAAKNDSQMTSSMTKTRVVNIRKQSLRAFGYKDLVDWLRNPDHVYIGRNMTHYVPGAVGSKWGNPFKMTKGATRESICAQYKEYVKTDKKVHENGKTLFQSLDELKGKSIGCWCHPEMCHGHMLVQLMEENCV